MEWLETQALRVAASLQGVSVAATSLSVETWKDGTCVVRARELVVSGDGVEARADACVITLEGLTHWWAAPTTLRVAVETAATVDVTKAALSRLAARGPSGDYGSRLCPTLQEDGVPTLKISRNGARQDRRRGCHRPRTDCDGAAAATWIVRGRVAAAPRLPRGSSVDKMRRRRRPNRRSRSPRRSRRSRRGPGTPPPPRGATPAPG